MDGDADALPAAPDDDPLAAVLAKRSWAWLFGSYAAGVALERGPLCLLLGSLAAVTLHPPHQSALVGALSLTYITLWLTVAAGHTVCLSACRRACRTAGLEVVVIVPESPALARWVHRRRGICLPNRSGICSVHVDASLRPSSLAPEQSAAAFARKYRDDYDRLLAGSQGRSLVLASCTFNRHESAWTRQAMAEGWGQQWPGPLFAQAPRRNGPAARGAQQRRMFGAVVSHRRVDHAREWRTRAFDCQAALACANGDARSCTRPAGHMPARTPADPLPTV